MKIQLAAAALTVSTVVGCTSTSSPTPGEPESCLAPQTDSVALVMPAHQGAPTGLTKTPRVTCAIVEALTKGLPVSVVTAEGTPKVVVQHLRLDPARSNSSEHLHAQALKLGQELYADADAAQPTSDGNDLNAAIKLADDTARAGGAHPQVISTDPGLTDTGAVQMTTPGMLVADADEVANAVKDAGQCPIGPGTTVKFFGLGYGVAPQSLLTPADQRNVTAIWTAVITACGGTAIQFPQPAQGDSPRTTHTVTPVTPSGYTKPKLTDPEPNDPITMTGASPLAFQTDEPHFRFPDEAKNVLDDVAKTLHTHPTWHLRIEGTTANGDTRHPSLQHLGQARADTVKSELIHRNIDPTRLAANGYGYTANPPQTDPATSALNRRTTLTYTLN